MLFRSCLVVGLALAVSATAMEAAVRLVIRKDGRPVLSNIPVRGAAPRRGSDLDWLAKQHNRSTIYDAVIDRYADRFGVDPVLVKAVIQVESNFNPQCVSNKGARGLMQLMPETAKRFGVKRMHDPEENIRGGVQYLSILLKLFSHDLRRTLAAYNAGEGAVQRHGGIPPYQETQTYVQRALTVYHGSPSGGGVLTISGSSGGRKLGGGFKTSTAHIAVTPSRPKPPLLARATPRAGSSRAGVR